MPSRLASLSSAAELIQDPDDVMAANGVVWVRVGHRLVALPRAGDGGAGAVWFQA
jgi:hypothetical protein